MDPLLCKNYRGSGDNGRSASNVPHHMRRRGLHVNYVTAIGLDVHPQRRPAAGHAETQRSSCALSSATTPRRSPSGPSGSSRLKAAYESGVTGFHPAAPCAPSASTAPSGPSRTQRPAADRGRKTDRRDAEFLARLLATRNVVGVWVPDERTEAARDLPRAGRRARRPAARQAEDVEVPSLRHGHVFDEPTPTGGRRAAGRGRTEVGRRDRVRRARRRRRLRHYRDCVRRCREARTRRWRGGSPSPPGAAGVEAGRGRAQVREASDVATAFLLACEMRATPPGSRARRRSLVVRARALGALERRDLVERADNPRGQRPRARSSSPPGTSRCPRATRSPSRRPGGRARGAAPRDEVQPQADRAQGP